MPDPGDIPVENTGSGVTGAGTNEKFTLKVGTQTLTVKTGGHDLKITVKSGDHACTIFPVDKKNWSLKIELV